MAGRTPAVVLGPPGLLRDLVTQLLAEHEDLIIDLTDDPEDAEGRPLVLLIEPRAEHWERARKLSDRIVFVGRAGADDGSVVNLVRSGAEAVVPIDASAEDALRTIAAVAEGGPRLSPAQARALVDALRETSSEQPAIRLTQREAQILAGIAQGQSVKQTARALGVSTKTIENLQTRMFRKLEVRNRAQALARAHALGLLEGDRREQGNGPSDDPPPTAP